MEEGKNSSNRVEHIWVAQEVISKEVYYLREKERRLFAWVTGIQIGTIGGVIGLAGMRGFVFPSLHRLLLIGASLILALYAFIWISF